MANDNLFKCFAGGHALNIFLFLFSFVNNIIHVNFTHITHSSKLKFDCNENRLSDFLPIRQWASNERVRDEKNHLYMQSHFMNKQFIQRSSGLLCLWIYLYILYMPRWHWTYEAKNKKNFSRSLAFNKLACAGRITSCATEIPYIAVSRFCRLFFIFIYFLLLYIFCSCQYFFKFSICFEFWMISDDLITFQTAVIVFPQISRSL